jgi:hypothetical protein
MPFNQAKKYPSLLELMHLSAIERIVSLKRIFKRDIEDNQNFIFRKKPIRPIKMNDGQPAMDVLFQHLTHEATESTDENGRTHKSRNTFEIHRSMRLHWIKYLVDGKKTDGIEIFSVSERDTKHRKDVIKTYLYDINEKYIIVFEPHRSKLDYYLLSAYHLNKSYGEKMIKKKLKNRLSEVY